MSPREHEFRLMDILQHIEKVLFAETQLIKYESSNHKDALAYQEMAFDAILYSLLVIGEAVKSLDLEMKNRYEYINWGEIIGMRDFLAHQYFLTEIEIIKSAIRGPLLYLKEACEFESKL